MVLLLFHPTKYRESLKNSDTRKSCNHPKILTKWLYHRVVGAKDADGMANSVGPDQTSPSGVWVYTVCSDLSVQKLGSLR